jgi:hypothetical protein
MLDSATTRTRPEPQSDNSVFQQFGTISRANQQQTEPQTLPPPMRLPIGSIVTLRMRGHSRTAGANQYDNPTGDIEVIVWDATAGTHYNPSFAIRELTTVTVNGENVTRESQSNIGQVLFEPGAHAFLFDEISVLRRRVHSLETAVGVLLKELGAAQPAPASSPASEKPQGALTAEKPLPPKAADKASKP